MRFRRLRSAQVTEHGFWAQVVEGAFIGVFLVVVGIVLGILALPIGLLLVAVGRLEPLDNWLQLPIMYLAMFVLYGTVGAVGGAWTWMVRGVPSLRLRRSMVGAGIGPLLAVGFTYTKVVVEHYVGSSIPDDPIELTRPFLLYMAIAGLVLGAAAGFWWDDLHRIHSRR